MSGIEILGIAAGVIQIADAGARLSTKLFVFSRKVKGADRKIKDLSAEIAATGAALRELGNALEQEKYANLGTQQSVESTSQIVADCWKVFGDIDGTLGGEKLSKPDAAGRNGDTVPIFKSSKLTFMQRMAFPFKEDDIFSLKTKLESLKTSLILMLQVLLLAEQVRNRPLVAITQEQTSLLQSLIDERNLSDREFHQSLKALENAPPIGYVPTRSMTDETTVLSDASSEVGATKDTGLVQANVMLQSNPDPGVSKFAHLQQRFVHPFVRPPDSTDQSTLASTDVPDTPLSTGTATPQISRDQNPSLPLVPMALRHRREEIADHAVLVQTLLEEISSVQYRINHRIRHGMQEGILETHLDLWRPFVRKHGHRYFMEVFEFYGHKQILAHWDENDDSDDDSLVIRGSSLNARAAPVDNSRPTYIRIHQDHILAETLNHFHLPWEMDPVDPNYYLIRRYVDHFFQEELFSHTRALRARSSRGEVTPTETAGPQSAWHTKGSSTDHLKGQLYGSTQAVRTDDNKAELATGRPSWLLLDGRIAEPITSRSTVSFTSAKDAKPDQISEKQDESFNLDFSTLDNADVLENFDFDSFLNDQGSDGVEFNKPREDYTETGRVDEKPKISNAEKLSKSSEIETTAKQQSVADEVQKSAESKNHALADYELQLMALEKQNKKRLLMARQEQELMARQEQEVAATAAAAVRSKNLALADYQLEIMRLEQQNKKILMMARHEQSLAAGAAAGAAAAAAAQSSRVENRTKTKGSDKKAASYSTGAEKMYEPRDRQRVMNADEEKRRFLAELAAEDNSFGGRPESMRTDSVQIEIENRMGPPRKGKAYVEREREDRDSSTKDVKLGPGSDVVGLMARLTALTDDELAGAFRNLKSGES